MIRNGNPALSHPSFATTQLICKDGAPEIKEASVERTKSRPRFADDSLPVAHNGK
jgi:hypothetical protein